MAKRITRIPARYRQRYTQHEIRRLDAMREAGMGFDEIGKALGRTPASSQTMARDHGIGLGKKRVRPPCQSSPPTETDPRGRQKILCLNCRNPFFSEGAHNRLCNRCRQIPSTPFDIPVTVLR